MHTGILVAVGFLVNQEANKVYFKRLWKVVCDTVRKLMRRFRVEVIIITGILMAEKVFSED
jgi:hypothetical protein